MVKAIDLSCFCLVVFDVTVPSHAYIRGLFQVNSGKLLNSIKCVSQLKVLTINSQPDRESDQT